MTISIPGSLLFVFFVVVIVVVWWNLTLWLDRHVFAPAIRKWIEKRHGVKLDDD